MTTRPPLGARPSSPYSPQLAASLATIAKSPARYLPPRPPEPIVRHRDPIEPLPANQQPAVERYPVRHTAVLAPPAATLWKPITALERARLWATAVTMERKTKAKGSRVGCFYPSGLQVLNALLFRFANSQSGRCDPSYTALQTATGLCRQTIADAINRLAQSGIVNVTRRWLRLRDPGTGQIVARQISNAYSFAAATKRLFALPAPLRAWRQIPSRSARDPHGNLARILKMSLLRRQEPKSPVHPPLAFDPRNPPDAEDSHSTIDHSASG